MALPAAASVATLMWDPELDASADAGVGGADPAALADELVLQRLPAAGLADMAVEELLVEAAAGRNLEPNSLIEIVC